MTAIVVGSVTFIAGVILVLRHLHVWRKQSDATDDPARKKFLWSQLRRRTLTSSCIAVLGFIIALFHFREYWRDRPTSWVILVCCSLVLVVMIFILAVLDMIAVSNVIRLEKNKTGDTAKELAQEYHRQKKKAADQSGEPASNGGSDQ